MARTVLAIGALIAAIALTAGLWPLLQPAPPPPVVADVPRPAEAVALTVEAIVDGDTIRAAPRRPEPFGGEQSLRVRLIGIDAPEADAAECGSAAATAALGALIPPGATVWAVPDVEARDRFQRWLLYLWTPDGRFVNDDLVRSGAVEVMRIAPNTTHADLFAASAAAAEAAGRGLWTACR